MNKAFTLILVAFLFSGCLTLKQQRINTAFKVADYLNECKIDQLRKLYASDPDKRLGYKDHLLHDCNRFQEFVKKYGFPSKSKVICTEALDDPFNTYTVELPIFKGQDTLRNWNIYEISVKIYFGPENLYKPNEIQMFELYYDFDIIKK